MIRNFQNLDKQTKYSLFTTTFVLALFVMFVLNVTVSIFYMLDLIKQPNFETISVTLKGGYYAINGNEIGAPLSINMLFFAIVWLSMTTHTLKSIFDLDYYLEDFK